MAVSDFLKNDTCKTNVSKQTLHQIKHNTEMRVVPQSFFQFPMTDQGVCIFIRTPQISGSEYSF